MVRRRVAVHVYDTPGMDAGRSSEGALGGLPGTRDASRTSAWYSNFSSSAATVTTRLRRAATGATAARPSAVNVALRSCGASAIDARRAVTATVRRVRCAPPLHESRPRRPISNAFPIAWRHAPAVVRHGDATPYIVAASVQMYELCPVQPRPASCRLQRVLSEYPLR